MLGTKSGPYGTRTFLWPNNDRSVANALVVQFEHEKTIRLKFGGNLNTEIYTREIGPISYVEGFAV